MKVSFCITCKNRFHQVTKTLHKNLRNNSANDAEFILVDFGSHDGLQDWIMQNFKNELASGYLKYYFTTELKSWDCSLAKNTAHYFATGDILVNLDCDNFTGKNGALFVKQQFAQYGNRIVLHQATSNPGDGSFGRIAVLKKYFHLIAGYDQSFQPMGYQDMDLILRLVKIGLMYVPKSNRLYNKAIPNTKEDSLSNTNSNKPYREMNHENMLLSVKNISLGHILANNGLWGIRDNITGF